LEVGWERLVVVVEADGEVDVGWGKWFEVINGCSWMVGVIVENIEWGDWMREC
jgi:hypothetical protein